MSLVFGQFSGEQMLHYPSECEPVEEGCGREVRHLNEVQLMKLLDQRLWGLPQGKGSTKHSRRYGVPW